MVALAITVEAGTGSDLRLQLMLQTRIRYTVFAARQRCQRRILPWSVIDRKKIGDMLIKAWKKRQIPVKRWREDGKCGCYK